MAMRAVSVAVAVSDRKAAAKWYTDVLGFHVVDDDPEHWTTIAGPRSRFLIHLCEVAGAGKKPPKSELGNTGILLFTDEPFARACARLKRRKVKFSMRPRKLPWGWVAKFLDPDGNEYWLQPEPGA